MSKLTDVQRYSPSEDYYNLTDKLYLHIMKRAEQAFNKADKRRDRIKTKEDFIKYREKARKTFLKCLGDIPYDNKFPLNAKVTGVTHFEGIKIENIIFEARKNVYITGNLYIPENSEGKLPGVLIQCGHSDLGHLFFNYRRACTTIAKAGNIVFAMSPIGQGERKNYLEIFKSDEIPTMEHQYCGNQCVLAGEALAKYFLADAMRGVDYLQSRSEVDADKIGAAGSSGGGTMTAVLAAVDERIKAAAPATFITTRREYFYAGGPQDAEQIWPGATLNLFDHYELISCICPRACMILGVTSDFFCREGTEMVFRTQKEFYKLLGVENKLQIFWDDSRHAFTPKLAKSAAEFFNVIFKGDKIEADIICPTKEYHQLTATSKANVLAEFKNSTLVFEENKKEFLEKKTKMTSKKIKNELTKKVFNFREPCDFNVRRIHEEEIEGTYIERIMWFSQHRLPCYGILFTPLCSKTNKSSATICLWEGGTNKIVEKEALIKKLNKQGQAVFVADLAGMGKCEPYPLNTDQVNARVFTTAAKLNSELIFLGDSLCALRTYDLIRCVDMLKESYGVEKAELYTEGFYSVYGEIAKKVGCSIETAYKNPIKIYDVITNKLYDDYHLADIMMPGLGLYID